MAGNQTVANLKLLFSSDTSELKKGSKEAKAAVKDFEDSAQGAVDSVANMFGVNTAAVDRLTSSLRGMGLRLKESANEGVQSFGKLLTSINGATAAIAGIGIGAVVAGFKALSAEAENFRSTVAGANMEMATAAYVNTYSQALHDLNSATGKSVAELESQMKKMFGRIKANVQQGMVNAITGNRSAEQAIAGTLLPGAGLFFGASREDRLKAKEDAERAEQLQKEIYEIQRKLSAETVRTADLDAQISEHKRTAFDTLKSTAERTAAVNKTAELIREKYEGANGLIALNTALADKMEEMVGLTNSTVAEEDAANQQRAKAKSIATAMNNELRELSEKQGTLARQAQVEAQARQQALRATVQEAEALLALSDKVTELSATDLSVSGNLKDSLPGVIGSDGGLTLPVRPVMDSQAVIDLTGELVGLADSMSAAIGGLVGDLVTGGDAWGNFRTAALSAFADMAISVGKLALSMGLASEGIKAALKLKPAAAIAAGAALIALGTAVKSGLSNIASGNMSSSASVATSGYSNIGGGASGYNMRAMTVEVTGTLKGDGNQLVAVINNTAKHNYYTG